MITCKQCGLEFIQHVFLDGKIRNLKNRVRCLDCNPWTGKSGVTPRLTVEGRRLSKRDARLRHLYGIDHQEVLKLQDSQSNKCAICKCDPPTSYKKSLSVDHDHNDGRIRGLLCTSCNSRLGWFEKYNTVILSYLST